MSRATAIGFVCGTLGGSAVAGVLRSEIPAMAGLNLLDPILHLMAMAFFAAVMAPSWCLDAAPFVSTPQQSAAARVATRRILDDVSCR